MLVIDGGGSDRCALFGDHIAKDLADNGWAGVLVNGFVRDKAVLKALPLGVKALGVIPTKSVKRGEGQVGLSLRFAGQVIEPGDMVVADEDGVVILTEQRKAELEEGVESSDSDLDDEGEPGEKWRAQEEFEGSKFYTPSQDACEYQYLHGPLCNALHRRLDELVQGHPKLKVGKHRVDLALVDQASKRAKAIFEVKTSASMSGQLFTAFGQLAYYKHRFGNAKTKLILVLPTSTAS